MRKNELNVQVKLNNMRKVAADADRERAQTLETIENLKKRMGD